MADPDGRLSPACLEDFEEESLDPRIQGELERLNKASEEINKLELELDDARAGFRQALSDSTHKLNLLAKKLGACVEKARPYYDARMKAREAHVDTQKAAIRFERACSMHEAAKEMVQLAEQGYVCREQPSDPAWQEMLNHATMKVNEAEKERMESETEHRKTMIGFQETEARVQFLQKELKRAIAKSKPYFEMKAKFNQTMEDQKRSISILEEDVHSSKTMYSEALRNLETISDEIHQQRIEKRRNEELGVREAGVGSETPSPPPCREYSLPEYSNMNTTSHAGGQGFVPPSVIHSSTDKARNPSYRSAIENRPDDGDPDFPVPSLESEYHTLPESRSPRGSAAISAYRQKGGSENSTEVFSTSPRDRSQSLRYMSTSPRENHMYQNDTKFRSTSLCESQYSTPSSGSPTRSRKKLQAGSLILKIDQAMDPLAGMYDTTQIKPTRLSQKSLSEKLGSHHKMHSQDSSSDVHEGASCASTPGSKVGTDLSSLNVPGREKDDSDSESVVSTGPMLDDDQVEFLTMDFSDKIGCEESTETKEWGSQTLPANLSHLQQYLHRKENKITESKNGESLDKLESESTNESENENASVQKVENRE